MPRLYRRLHLEKDFVTPDFTDGCERFPTCAISPLPVWNN